MRRSRSARACLERRPRMARAPLEHRSLELRRGDADAPLGCAARLCRPLAARGRLGPRGGCERLRFKQQTASASGIPTDQSLAGFAKRVWASKSLGARRMRAYFVLWAAGVSAQTARERRTQVARRAPFVRPYPRGGGLLQGALTHAAIRLLGLLSCLPAPHTPSVRVSACLASFRASRGSNVSPPSGIFVLAADQDHSIASVICLCPRCGRLAFAPPQSAESWGGGARSPVVFLKRITVAPVRLGLCWWWRSCFVVGCKVWR